MKRALVLIACLTVGLQTKLWFEPNSILGIIKLNQAIAEQQSANYRLQQSNSELRAQVSDLKRGTDAIEEHARTELGFVKQGEVFFQFIQST